MTAPAALIAHANPAPAQFFLNEAQALEAIFGRDLSVAREAHHLDDAQRQRLEHASGLHFPERQYTFLVVAKNGKFAGYALVMDEIGKTEPITFLVGMDPDGRVAVVAVVDFRESRGWEVKEKRFLRKFHGKRAGDPIQVDRDIINYSGATLSSK